MQSPVTSLSPFPSRPFPSLCPASTSHSPPDYSSPQSPGFHSPALKSSTSSLHLRQGTCPRNQRNRPQLRGCPCGAPCWTATHTSQPPSSQGEPGPGSGSFSCTSSSHTADSSLSEVLGSDPGKRMALTFPSGLCSEREAAQDPGLLTRPDLTVPAPSGAAAWKGPGGQSHGKRAWALGKRGPASQRWAGLRRKRGVWDLYSHPSSHPTHVHSQVAGERGRHAGC